MTDTQDELRPANPHYRPHLITTSRVLEAERAFDRLLAKPPSFWRRMHWGRQTIEFFEHENRSWLSERDEAYLRERGFRPLAHTLTHSPGPFSELAVRSELWIDVTTTIKVEVRGAIGWGCGTDEMAEALSAGIGSAFITTYFDDATSLLMLPDNIVTESFQCERRVALSGTEDITKDLPRFLEHRDALLAEGRVPLPCADVVMYAKHHELHARYFMSPDTIKESLLMELGMDGAVAAVALIAGLALWLWTSISGAFLITVGVGSAIGTLVKFARTFGDRYPQEALADAMEARGNFDEQAVPASSTT